MSQSVLPLFNLVPLGGHSDYSAQVVLRLDSRDKRMVHMRHDVAPNSARNSFAGAAVASDLVPGSHRGDEIRLSVSVELIVQADGEVFTLICLQDQMSGGHNRLYVTYDEENPPPLDQPLSLVETRRLH